MIAPSGEQVEISFEEHRAVIVEVGAGLRTYSAGERPILDRYDVDEMCRSGRGQVLIPWPNRIRGGTYELDGCSHQLPLNEPEHRNAIHGLVRWARWTVGERADDRVVMEHVLHPRPGYPFTLLLAIEYALSREGLRVTTTATNQGRERCPFGAGAHPYLTAGTDTVDPVLLRVPARTVLESDERGIPTGRGTVAGTSRDFREARKIGETVLDHAFTDLERDAEGLARVRLTAPPGGPSVELWVDESYPYLMIFTGDPLPDVARRSLAVEPMTCPPDAFNSGEALTVLEPGASFTGAWGIGVADSRAGYRG
jgi:aldose 1-epimerase